MKKYQTVVLYIIWGCLTTIINLSIVYALTQLEQMEGLSANIIAWFVSNYVMFVGIKKTVFKAKTTRLREYLLQLNYYYLGRVVTLAIEEVIIWKMVEIDGYDLMPIKVMAIIFNGIINLVFSKAVVFNSNELMKKGHKEKNLKEINSKSYVA